MDCSNQSARCRRCDCPTCDPIFDAIGQHIPELGKTRAVINKLTDEQFKSFVRLNKFANSRQKDTEAYLRQLGILP